MLTRAGLGVLLAAAALIGGGLGFGFVEFVVVGIALALVVAVAVLLARRPARIEVNRRLVTRRVPRTAPIRVSYDLRNSSRFASFPFTVSDSCDGAEIGINAPSIPRSGAVQLVAHIPTRRRGEFPVGPCRLERSDPFGLARGTVELDGEPMVLVHPRVYPMAGASGTMHVVESESVVRRSLADPMSGFVALREYVPGDDPRLIHWPTTARTGTLMVREHVELRRPKFTIVIDTSVGAATPDDFEELVDAAASLAAHVVRSGMEVVIRTTSRQRPGRSEPLVREADALELLTALAQASGVELLTLAAIFIGGIDDAAVLVLTGPAGPSSALAGSSSIVVRVGAGAQPGQGIALAVRDAPEFALRWKALQ